MIQLKDVCKYYQVGDDRVRALDHANLPDPMLERMQALYHRLTDLEKVLRDCACRLGCDQCAEESAHCPLKKQDHSNENPAS